MEYADVAIEPEIAVANDAAADHRLFPYQREHVAKLIAAIGDYNVALDTSDTGTGKTYTAAAVCAILGLRPLVICPKSVISTWYAVLAEFDIIPLAVINYETAKNGKYYPSADAFEIEYREPCPYIEKLRGRAAIDTQFAWTMPPGSIVIWDEAHKGKNNITVNSHLMIDSRAAVLAGAKMLILSATITDRVNNFRTTAYLLGLAQRAPHAYRTWLSMMRAGDPNRNISAEIHRVIFGGKGVAAMGQPAQMTPRGSRMSIDDIRAISDLFRDNDVRAELYQMSPEVEAEIEEQHELIAEALEALRGKEQPGANPLVKLIRARQRIELLKVPTFVDLIIDALAANQSPVLFVNFSETADKVAATLEQLEVLPRGIAVEFIRGGQSGAERRDAIERFQRNQSLVLIANIQAGGVGLSLHDIRGRQRFAIHSPSWSSIDYKQALGRIFRAGALSNARQRIVFCGGRTRPHHGNDSQFGCDGAKVNVEELMAANVNEKLRTIEWINTGNQDNVQLIEAEANNAPAQPGPGDIHW